MIDLNPQNLDKTTTRESLSLFTKVRGLYFIDTAVAHSSGAQFRQDSSFVEIGFIPKLLPETAMALL